MLKTFILSVFLLTIGAHFFFPLVDSNGPITNSVFLECIWSPVLYLIYQVDPTSLQQYIDPRFTPAQFNNSSYVILALSNASSTTPGGSSSSFTTTVNIIIYTIVSYKNETRRENLFTAINNTAFAALCQPAVLVPYGCVHADSTSLTLDNQTRTFSFYTTLNAKSATINVTANFNRNQTINVDDPTSSIAGFTLSKANNMNFVESRYTKQHPIENLPIATGMIVSDLLTEVDQCQLIQLQSNYIAQTIGPITGLNDSKPILCLYTPYNAANITFITALPV